MLRLFLTTIILTLSLTAPALADCASPAGAESATRYDFTAHKLYYCDGTNWVELGGAAGGGGDVAGDLCGLAYGKGQSNNCSSVSYSSVSPCAGQSITSSCPPGYVQRTIETASITGSCSGVCSPTKYCTRTCSKN